MSYSHKYKVRKPENKLVDECLFDIIKSVDTDSQKRVYSVGIFRPAFSRNNKLGMYLQGLVRASQILNQHLPDWIMRIYIDNSLLDPKYKRDFVIANKYFNNGTKKYPAITTLDNVEIYQVVCPEFLSPGEKEMYNHTGMFGSVLRFHVAYDPHVSHSVIRDTDFHPNSVRNDIEIIKNWVASGKKYFVYYSPLYSPEHSNDIESMYAGAWGLKGNLPIESWELILSEFRTGIYHVKTLIDNIKLDISHMITTSMQELSEDEIDKLLEIHDLSTEMISCKFSTTDIDTIRRLVSGVQTADNFDLVYLIARFTKCIEHKLLETGEIIDILDLNQSVKHKRFDYGIDEIIMNRVVKYFIFNLEQVLPDIDINQIDKLPQVSDTIEKVSLSVIYSVLKGENVPIVDPRVELYYEPGILDKMFNFFKTQYESGQWQPDVYMILLITPEDLIKKFELFLQDEHQTNKILADYIIRRISPFKKMTIFKRALYNIDTVTKGKNTDLAIQIPTITDNYIKSILNLYQNLSPSYLDRFQSFMKMPEKQFAKLNIGALAHSLDRLVNYYDIETYEDYKERLITSIIL